MTFAVMQRGKMMSKRLIYEEDAIEALKQLQKSISNDYTELDPLVMAGCGYIGDCIGELECLPSAQLQLEECPIYGGMCGYPSNLCYECPRHGGAHITDVDLLELRDRFGKEVADVVADMISGEEKRWKDE